jgi:hypothetical protein
LTGISQGVEWLENLSLNFFGGIFRERKREERKINPVSTGLLASVE